MKSMVQTLVILTVLVAGSLPVFAQDDETEKLERKLDRLSSQLESQLDRLAERIEMAFNNGDNEDETTRALEEELREEADALREQLAELELEEASEEKEYELKALEAQLKAIEARLKALQGKKTSKKYEYKYKFDTQSENDEVTRWSNDSVIEKDETIDSKVEVINGDLTVFGTINGDALAINGNVILKESAVVDGNVMAISGKVIREEGSKVTGTVSEIDSKSAVDVKGGSIPPVPPVPPVMMPRKWKNGDSDLADWGKNWEMRWDNNRHVSPDGDDLDFQFAYNRAEGLYMGLEKLKDYYWGDDRQFSTYGFLGYSFGNRMAQYQAGLDRWFNDEYRTEIGGRIYAHTTPKDSWKFPQVENSIMAIVAREDFLDWYEQRGWSVHLRQYLTADIRLSVAYNGYRDESVQNNVQWSVFGGDKVFRLNPAFQNGETRSISFKGELDKVSKLESAERSGVYMMTEAELAGTSGKGDFSYNQYNAELRWYFSISEYDRFSTRLRVGSGEGNVPLQKLYEIGGIGSLPGYRYNEFAGNRMILLNVENEILSEDLKEELPGPLDEFNLLLMADVGYINAVKTGDSPWEGFEIGTDKLKTGLGIGFASDSGNFRTTLNWRTDKGGDPVQFMIRFSQPF